MGRVVAVGCVAHSPGLTGFPERAPADAASRVFAGFSDLAARLAQSQPDAVVVVSGEHFTNFFVSNLPTFAVGTATGYELPATDAFAGFLGLPRRRYPGAAGLGEALFAGLLARDFDPALVAGGYGFDEGFAVPLTLLTGERAVPVVPVVVNTLHPPYPSLGRCWSLGRALRQAIEDQDRAARVAVLGTGGLSHWVGLARAGEINGAFDRAVIAALGSGDPERLLALTDHDIDQAGNGAHEIRAWVVAAGVAGAVPFDLLAYEPVPAWLTGTCVMAASDGAGALAPAGASAGASAGGEDSKP